MMPYPKPAGCPIPTVRFFGVGGGGPRVGGSAPFERFLWFLFHTSASDIFSPGLSNPKEMTELKKDHTNE